MISSEVFLKLPIRFNKYIRLYPPSVKEMVGEGGLGITYLSILTNSKEEIADYWQEQGLEGDPPNPWEYLTKAMEDENSMLIVSSALYFFTKTEFTYIPKLGKFLIGNLKEEVESNKTLNDFKFFGEEEFFDFQNGVRKICGLPEVERPDPDEDPRITRMKAKARYRDKVKARSGKGTSLDLTLMAICCMGIGITPLNIGEVSYASINEIVRLYQQKESYELNQKLLLAGAKNVSKEYWIR